MIKKMIKKFKKANFEPQIKLYSIAFREAFKISLNLLLTKITFEFTENFMQYWNVTNSQKLLMGSFKQCGWRRIIMKQKSLEGDL